MHGREKDPELKNSRKRDFLLELDKADTPRHRWLQIEFHVIANENFVSVAHGFIGDRKGNKEKREMFDT